MASCIKLMNNRLLFSSILGGATRALSMAPQMKLTGTHMSKYGINVPKGVTVSPTEVKKEGLYRRVLPSHAVEFASSNGKQLFTEALQRGHMEGYFKLISYYQTQSEFTYCGLASLSMVLNALAIDPGRKWKGPWRWFDESMLDSCESLEKIKAEGIAFGKAACLAHCNGAKVEAFRTNQTTIDDFRKYVMICTSSEDCHMITSYSRPHLEQTGSGHYSPIGGYHAGSDMVLILDVARFKYPPHWVPLTLLWNAMNTVVKATGQHRGFMLISRLQKAQCLLCTLSCSTAKYLIDYLPLILKTKDVKDVEEILSFVFALLPTNCAEFIKWVSEVRRQEYGGPSISKEERGRLAVKEELFKQVQETELNKHVSEWLSSKSLNYRKIPSLGGQDTLSETAANVCSHGVELLTGKPDSFDGYCCRETCAKSLKANRHIPAAVVSGTVVTGSNEQGIDMLVPLSQTELNFCGSGPSDCIQMDSASNDVLTVLLFALPPHIWSSIKEEKLLKEIYSLVSTENLPPLLQEEVLHLRRPLDLLMTDLGAPSP